MDRTVAGLAFLAAVMASAACTTVPQWQKEGATKEAAAADLKICDAQAPIEPGTKLSLDPTLLARFPEGYRHLGYLQTKAGFTVRLGLPGLRGPEVQKLYAEGAAWLAGSAKAGEPL